jgi:UDP-3-O-[3-hydroxymyristoyl] glucosamine N-acyltransferase
MADKRALTLHEVAALVEGRVVRGDGERVAISGVGGIDTAGPSDITFLEDARWLGRLASSAAGAVLVSAPVDGVRAAQIQVAGRPYLSFLTLVDVFHPRRRPAPGIHASAIVHPDAILEDAVTVGPLAVVKAGARIGTRTIVGSQSYVGPGAVIGADCHLFPRVVVRGRSRLGDRVLVHCGAVIGDDGFGYVRAGDRHVKVPHIGHVVVEDDVEIGANTTIDRGTFGETVIGAGTKIDNLVMIAHNVRIGQRCILAGQVGIAGSSTVGDDTVLAGQVGIASNVRVGSRVIATSKCGIPGAVPDGEIVSGIPAHRHRPWKRVMAILFRLPEILARLRTVERRLGIDARRTAAGGDRAGPQSGG